MIEDDYFPLSTIPDTNAREPVPLKSMLPISSEMNGMHGGGTV
jgi:hypothetical protein